MKRTCHWCHPPRELQPWESADHNVHAGVANHGQTWRKLGDQRELEEANRKAKRFLLALGLLIAVLIIASFWLD